jgi:RimJ/RimL family protein N-acetyltransferase
VAPEEEILTDRLILRRWRASDREPFATMNADPLTMRFMPRLLEREQSDGFVDRIEDHFAGQGWGLWALEVRGQAPFIGFTGLWPAVLDAPFCPATEVGWRLTPSAWGQGYASEAARAALRVGFEGLGLPEIVSFTAVLNEPSWRVMERIGMRRDLDGDFDHPSIEPEHRLRPHVLYRLEASEWARQEQDAR